MKKALMTVVDQQEIAAHIFKLTVNGSLVQEMTTPGQFVHVKVSEGMDPLLRRPISICDIDHEKAQFTMIYRQEGQGTTILSRKSAGDQVDILGPLGNGYSLENVHEGETAVLVGGGIGVPPLYYLSKQLNKKGIKTVHVLGFQTEEVSFYEEEFSALGDTYIATVDGTKGTKGFVTDVIQNEGITSDILFSCGPVPMLKALEQQYEGKRGFISLEQRMGCGIGACFACVCHLQADPNGFSYKKVCSDGPVFPLGEVIL